MSGKKILMLAGEFSEEYEIFVFEQAMTAVGHVVHVVCPGQESRRPDQGPRCTISRAALPIRKKPGHLQTLKRDIRRGQSGQI